MRALRFAPIAILLDAFFDFSLRKIPVKWSEISQPQRLEIDAQGRIWFSERQGKKIGRFDPQTQTFRELRLPGPEASPYAIGIDAGGRILVFVARAGHVQSSRSGDRTGCGRSLSAFGDFHARPFS